MPPATDKQTYRAIGLMSGSSLDGLDIACCDFMLDDGIWTFDILAADCIAYDREWQDKLQNAINFSGYDLWQLHTSFGHYCGRLAGNFVRQHKLENILFVASHGQTIFHAPHLGFTTQIGDGSALAAEAHLPVICDFRSGDVAKGGQGAPLVPMGDQLLFGNHAALLNLGGIANISVRTADGLIAGDICPVNQLLNFYAAQRGVAYDKDGALAARGTVHQELLATLNDLQFYSQDFPKSLDNSYSRDVVIPLVETLPLSLEDKLATLCEHIALQIALQAKIHLPDDPVVPGTILVTGGGANNGFLVKRLKAHLPAQVTIPDETILNYKEAIIFAFLGVLRWRQTTNILAKATGAETDSIGGCIYLP